MSTENEKFEIIKKNTLKSYYSQLKRLKKIKEDLLLSQENKDSRKIDFYTQRINNISDSINRLKCRLNCIRPNKEEDLLERKEIMANFAREVDESIPDNVPIVFHGNDNIEIVKQIIKSGGLFTPDERNIDPRSFATQIDVTYKKNIRVSLEFAEGNSYSFMPYGAIFTFYPKEYEYEKVLKTGESSEVPSGVESINFKTENDRLIGIITTNENLNDLKNCCRDNNIDDSKVFTHKQFTEYCKNNFLNKKKNQL